MTVSLIVCTRNRAAALGACLSAIAAIRHAVQSALNKNREYESGKVRPLDRVKLALNNKDA